MTKHDKKHKHHTGVRSRGLNESSSSGHNSSFHADNKPTNDSESHFLTQSFMLGTGVFCKTLFFSAPSHNIGIRLRARSDSSVVVEKESSLSAAKRIVREEGIFSLWRGASCFAKFAFVNRFAVHALANIADPSMSLGNVDTFFRQSPAKFSLQETAFNLLIRSAALAISHPLHIMSAHAVTKTYPSSPASDQPEVASETIQKDSYPKSTRQHFKRIVSSDGYKGLVSGLPSALLALAVNEIAYAANRSLLLHFMGVDTNSMLDVSGSLSNDFSAKIDWASAFASICARAISYPLRVISTKMMIRKPDGSAPLYASEVDCFHSVIAADGVRGLYSGFTVDMIGAGIGLAASPASLHFIADSIVTKIIRSFIPESLLDLEKLLPFPFSLIVRLLKWAGKFLL